MLIDAAVLTLQRPAAPLLAFAPVRIVAGERVLLLGPSGCGKTTLLSMLAGLLPPTSGTVMFEGQDIYALPARRRDALRGRRFGFVFQTLHLLPSLTLRQNIALAGDMAGGADDSRVDSLLQTLGLAAKAHRRPEALSQGEQQRAAIARAVLNRPAVIIADEPTSALDGDNARTVIDLLTRQAAENNAALIVATHDHRITKDFQTIIRLDATDLKAAA